MQPGTRISLGMNKVLSDLILPHTVGPGPQLLADARETGIEVLHQAGLDHLVRQGQLERPRHGDGAQGQGQQVN